MLNLLWLLLPVAAVAGWFAAKRSAAKRTDVFWNYSADFHQGLNVLLNAPQDLPEELFDNISDTDNDTAETHLALGNLYRRRGDVNRAIVLHESLVNKSDLSEELQATALYELAKDFDSAGLLDRSEATLRTLIEKQQRLPDAYAALLQLHERERDWGHAIEIASEIERATGKDHTQLVGHYYCELATEAQSAGYKEEAASLLNTALERAGKCARAHMMLSNLAKTEGDHASALHHFEQVEALRPELMPDIIDDWFETLLANGDTSALRRFVQRIAERRNAYSVIRTTRAIIKQLDGVDLAERFFKDQILQRPSLKGLRDWAHDQLAISKPDERDKVQVICALLDKVVEEKPAYRCGSCGFLGNMLHWRCPGCSNWDTVQPIIGVEGE